MEITDNEMRLVLLLFKSPEIEYNANSMAKKLGLSSMGALKIARRLENEGIIRAKEKGQARFYTLNLANGYVRQYIRFLLKREAEQSHGYIKRWVHDLRNLKNADCGILFGSLLKNGKNAGDVDVLLITDNIKFSRLKQEIEKINTLNIKKLHPMFQTREDIKDNIKKEDKPLLNALKGVVVFGEDVLIEALNEPG
ncbi:MAG TPA: hypothetical protein VJH95_01760 [Candidatus Nanoarchaeia archaeon]|nr:hypothetical protein [Candidatus Nanoarchaeia archaeon]